MQRLWSLQELLDAHSLSCVSKCRLILIFLVHHYLVETEHYERLFCCFFQTFSSLLIQWESLFLSRRIGLCRVQPLMFSVDVFQWSYISMYLLKWTIIFYCLYHFCIYCGFLYFKPFRKIYVESVMLRLIILHLSCNPLTSSNTKLLPFIAETYLIQLHSWLKKLFNDFICLKTTHDLRVINFRVQLTLFNRALCWNKTNFIAK